MLIRYQQFIFSILFLSLLLFDGLSFGENNFEFPASIQLCGTQASISSAPIDVQSKDYGVVTMTMSLIEVSLEHGPQLRILTHFTHQHTTLSPSQSHNHRPVDILIDLIPLNEKREKWLNIPVDQVIDASFATTFLIRDERLLSFFDVPCVNTMAICHAFMIRFSIANNSKWELKVIQPVFCFSCFF